MNKFIWFFAVLFFPGLLLGQSAVIASTNMLIVGSVDGEKIAWASDQMNVGINKYSGEFVIRVSVDQLEFQQSNPAVKRDENNATEFIQINRTIPMRDVLTEDKTDVDLLLDVEVSFKDAVEITPFTFALMRVRDYGFSMMAQGKVHLANFDTPNLNALDDELFFFFSIVGR